MCLTITNVFNQLGAKPLKPMIKIDFWYFQWLYYNDVKIFNYSINVLISWFIRATSQEHELEMLEGQHTTGWITLTVSKLHCIVLFCLAKRHFLFCPPPSPKLEMGVFLEGLRLCSPEQIARISIDPALELPLVMLYLSSFKQAPSTPN